jgi:hypothetical protein
MPRTEAACGSSSISKGGGVDLYRVACEPDLEGIVGKWATGSYLCDIPYRSPVKMRSRSYSQMEGTSADTQNRQLVDTSKPTIN